jgi:hypothetical protein
MRPLQNSISIKISNAFPRKTIFQCMPGASEKLKKRALAVLTRPELLAVPSAFRGTQGWVRFSESILPFALR